MVPNPLLLPIVQSHFEIQFHIIGVLEQVLFAARFWCKIEKYSWFYSISDSNDPIKSREDLIVKKWEKLESKINAKLEKTFSNVGDAVSSTTPEKIRGWREGFGQKISNAKQSIIATPMTLTAKLATAKQNLESNAHDLKVNLNHSLKEARKGKYSRFGVAASIIALLEWALLPFYKKLATLLSTMQPSTLASTIVLVTVGTITGIGVINSGNKIAEEAGLVERAPAAIRRVSEPRPKYYKRNERELLVSNVVIPSYIEGTTSLKKLQVDFTVISSNRYIREYFYDNSHLVEDVFNSKIEPMLPGFPLGEEGKLILKDKIKDELNALLKRMKIEGEIDQVYISSLLAA